MLSLSSPPASTMRSLRHWKTASAIEAAALVRSGTTVAVAWLGDGVANALRTSFLERTEPRELTIVYSNARGHGRTHGLNLLAYEGMVRRVIGGQWNPVPRLQALARLGQIEAYSLPTGIINRLFRDIAAGLPGHVSRSGLGTFTDPRNGGGRLNQTTREELVHVVHAAGAEALLFRAFPIDIGLVPVAFLEGTGAIAMTRDAMTLARAAHACGGMVIAQIDHIGTIDKLSPGQVEVPETLVDVLVAADMSERSWETFVPVSSKVAEPAQARLTHRPPPD